MRRYAEQLPSTNTLQLLADCTGLRWILVHAAAPAREPMWQRLPGPRTRPPRSGCALWPPRSDTTAFGAPARLPSRVQGRLALDDLPASPAPGSETLRFAAWLRHPAKPGRYALHVEVGAEGAPAVFSVARPEAEREFLAPP